MTAVMEAPSVPVRRVDARVEQAELEALGERICSGATWPPRRGRGYR
jgi:hypothetical protein